MQPPNPQGPTAGWLSKTFPDFLGFQTPGDPGIRRLSFRLVWDFESGHSEAPARQGVRTGGYPCGLMASVRT